MPTVRTDRLCTGSCHLATFPNPSRANTPAQLTPHHSFVHDLSQLGPGKGCRDSLGAWGVVWVG